jgi:hypothetical protein
VTDGVQQACPVVCGFQEGVGEVVQRFPELGLNRLALTVTWGGSPMLVHGRSPSGDGGIPVG